ncbi:MAG: hypothetical protein Q8L95_07920 [Burkholderiales bacterium]|nr:hypothetical protein [Burkholderiales bacterium]
MPVRTLAAAALVLLLTGCEGLLGGEEAARIPLQPAADGGYAPVRILLKPEMNPVAFNLHADFAWGRRDEGSQWNTYRATLSTGGKVIRAQEFSVNSPENSNVSTSSSPPPNSLRHTMLLVDLPGEAEYEIAIAAVKPVAVTLNAPQLGVRINVPRLPKF